MYAMCYLFREKGKYIASVSSLLKISQQYPVPTILASDLPSLHCSKQPKYSKLEIMAYVPYSSLPVQMMTLDTY
jgi:hypothetical protein